jgi:hypothetical protein
MNSYKKQAELDYVIILILVMFFIVTVFEMLMRWW